PSRAGRQDAPTAAGKSSPFLTTDNPIVDPCLFGFTTKGSPSCAQAYSGSAGAISHLGVGTSRATNNRLARSLSIAAALPTCSLPVYWMPAAEKTALIDFSSSVPPASPE